MTRVYRIEDPDLPEELNTVKKVFSEPVKPAVEENPRGRNEGLHDYLTRKGIQCFCKSCRSERERVNNSSLDLGGSTDNNSDDSGF